MDKKNGYDSITINSSNPLTRLAHRSRIKKGYNIVLTRLSEGRLLDYGCGTGTLLNEIKQSTGKWGGVMDMNLIKKIVTQKIFLYFQTIMK